LRELSLEELELIVGTGTTTGEITRIPVTGYPPSSSFPPEWAAPSSSVPSAGPDVAPAPSPNCEPVYSSQDRVDQDHIKQDEKSTNIGVQPTSNSGLTIGYGIDLKSKDVNWLTSAGISQAAVNVLSPFAHAAPSTIPSLFATYGHPYVGDPDLALMYNKAYSENYQLVTSAYNAATASNGFAIQFTQLPAAAQTVIMDMGYQTPNLSTYHNFWTYITNGEWAAAAYELRNWSGPGQTSPRKSALADMLDQAITSGQLPAISSGKCQ
jgi:hypothetical protein